MHHNLHQPHTDIQLTELQAASHPTHTHLQCPYTTGHSVMDSAMSSSLCFVFLWTVGFWSHLDPKLLLQEKGHCNSS